MTSPSQPHVIQTRPDFSGTVDLDNLELTGISCGQPKLLVGRQEDLNQHLDLLFHEFSGKPLLAFYHASLIVRIRRGESQGTAFRNLWSAKCAFLSQTLSLRWLVSACDTIVDNEAFDPVERAHALAVSLLMASVKLYETEYRALGTQLKGRTYLTGNVQPLFDGITTFSIGHGDLIINLMARCRTVADSGGTSGSILREVLRRLHASDTVFKRFLAVHESDRTRWLP